MDLNSVNVWDLVPLLFEGIREAGYLGIFVLMAMESSILPVPSELVVPPAAYWAAQGEMSYAGVILAATLGSYFGSAVTYGASSWLGKPFLIRYGKYFLLSPKILAWSEHQVKTYGLVSVFFGRLLPVVRHFISIPAGIFRLNFMHFSLVTFLGAGIWCSILTWMGVHWIGAEPALMQEPERLMHVLKEKSFSIGICAFLFLAAYIGVKFKSSSFKTPIS